MGRGTDEDIMVMFWDVDYRSYKDQKPGGL